MKSEKFVLGHDKRSITDGDLLADLRRVASGLVQGLVQQRSYKAQGRYGVTTIIRRFGSWNAAIKAAGLEATVERNIPDEKLFSALYDLWVGLGRQPSYSEVQAPACKFHVATFERRFGSWRQALEQFVEYTNSEDLPPAVAAVAPVPRRSSRTPDLRLRFMVLQRDHFRCCTCGASPSASRGVKLEVDHIVPWSKGGETVSENLQTLCFNCNQGKTNFCQEA